ncbi:uncharacterized protein [Aegilops tauschii subsp. strangulata]|uniref:uncharacterized protein n=1 Tax=Aegilops tauschii subsp. strangulata TaxID=200361 RepID=UPI00098B12A3|nr:uncharacterized protein LOC109741430 [Aegilops tauschii subsp. strangulata]
MWRGMWSSGRGTRGGDAPEQKQCAATNAVRKRSARSEKRAEGAPAAPRYEEGARAGAAGRWRRWAGGFPPLAEADAFEVAILVRSAREEGEAEQRRRHDSDLYKVLLEQGLTKAKEFDDSLAAWHCEAKAHDDIYIDLSSDDED